MTEQEKEVLAALQKLSKAQNQALRAIVYEIALLENITLSNRIGAIINDSMSSPVKELQQALEDYNDKYTDIR